MHSSFRGGSGSQTSWEPIEFRTTKGLWKYYIVIGQIDALALGCKLTSLSKLASTIVLTKKLAHSLASVSLIGWVIWVKLFGPEILVRHQLPNHDPRFAPWRFYPSSRFKHTVAAVTDQYFEGTRSERGSTPIAEVQPFFKAGENATTDVGMVLFILWSWPYSTARLLYQKWKRWSGPKF